jgi:D-alanine-D-alanine ligase
LSRFYIFVALLLNHCETRKKIIIMAKRNVALVAGGYSGEYVISIGSAAIAAQHINPRKYNVYKIIITQEKWYYENPNGGEILIDKSDFSLKIGRKKIKFDVALVIIHGTPGEDGKLQSYFDLLNIPYTSCDAITSALTFNKRWTVATAAFSGIHVAKSIHLFKEHPLNIPSITDALAFPVFVKPNNGGSSIGMSRVIKTEDLPQAIAKAFKEDDQVLVEEFVKGREFTVGIMRTKGKLLVLPICEVVTKKAFFDYEAKYQGASEELIPAPIDKKQKNVLQETAQKIYQIFNCKGIVRIDFIWNAEKNVPYMLEINTVPGQSQNSIVPQMVKAHGWTMQEFYSLLIEECFN